jgi:predicted dinucleotide-binding enzyme
MKVGFIGAGGIGSAFATQVAKGGNEVIVSNSRGPETLAGVVAALGPRAKAATREEAARAEVVVIAVKWPQVPSALAGLPAWNGRILVDATNPVVEPDFRLAELGGKASSEVVASLAPGARVVKVGNTLPIALLGAEARQAVGRRVLFMSGDDAPAKATVAAILEKVGFAIVDLGALAIGGKLQQFPGGPLPGLNLIKLD